MLTLSTNWQLFTALSNAKKLDSSSGNGTGVSDDGQTYALRKVSLCLAHLVIFVLSMHLLNMPDCPFYL
jgi:hypothetical protein